MNAHLPDDEQILQRIQAGDKEACALCIEKYGASLYRLALRLTQNEAEAEDVVQETFLNAFKAIHTFEGRSELGTWLYRIAHNNALMRLRRPYTPTYFLSTEETDTLSEEGHSIPHQLFDWCCLPEQDFQTAETHAALEAAIADLSPALRAVFVLREMEGLSTQETAVALSLSEDVVKTRLHRARLQLRETLASYFVETQRDPQ